jgi:diacylglycerol kinase family enzyme
MIWSAGGPRSRRAVRLTDSVGFRVTASRPVACQVDGDYLGTLDAAVFRSVPGALNVLAMPPRAAATV